MVQGSGGINLAIFNRETDFGITVHKISKEYDDGEILDFFPIELKTETFINDCLILINNKKIKIIKNIISKICKRKSLSNIFLQKITCLIGRDQSEKSMKLMNFQY